MKERDRGRTKRLSRANQGRNDRDELSFTEKFHRHGATRMQEMIADSSPVRGNGFRGDPFFDPWAPGGTFNK